MLNLISLLIRVLTGDGEALACGALRAERLPGAAAAVRFAARAHAHAAGADAGHNFAALRPPLRRARMLIILQKLAQQSSLDGKYCPQDHPKF